jgi:hypothetical protein
MWIPLATPPLWLVPAIWHAFWRYATCRHPTSFWDSRPAGEIVTRGDFGPRRRRPPRRMDCNSARMDGEHCGPQARLFAARRYPFWLWPAGSIIIGSLTVAGFCLLLMFLLRQLPTEATQRQFGWDRYHDRQNACAMRRQKQRACANYADLSDETAL